jgi:hypothetical protein
LSSLLLSLSVCLSFSIFLESPLKIILIGFRLILIYQIHVEEGTGVNACVIILLTTMGSIILQLISLAFIPMPVSPFGLYSLCCL